MGGARRGMVGMNELARASSFGILPSSFGDDFGDTRLFFGRPQNEKPNKEPVTASHCQNTKL